MTDVGHERDGTAVQYAEIDEPPAPSPHTRSENLVARLVAAIVWLLPYALVALVLRLVMARVFFVSGQAKVDGPVITIAPPGFDWAATVTLPMAVKDRTYQMFDQLAALPLPSWLAAPTVCAIEFVLPVCLVIGLATRFSAIVLFILTVAIQLYAAPGALWFLHIYWMAILLVLVSLGPGLISVDHLLRHLYEK